MAHPIPRNREEATALLENDIKVQVAGVDIDGILRGKVLTKDKFLSSLENGFGFCSVVFKWDMHDETLPTDAAAAAEENYGDYIAKADLSTYRRIEGNIPFFLLRFYESRGRPLSVCPRSLLARVVDDYQAQGLEPLSGAEFEFYCYRETPQTLHAKEGVGLEPMTPGNFGYSLLRPSLEKEFFNDIFDRCQAVRVPIEGLHTETGPGVMEAALVYSPSLQMGDQAVLFKTTVKQLGLKYGVIPSFMAKPYTDLPGCSGHLHFSLRSSHDGSNVFFDPDARPSPKDPHRIPGMSDTFAAFLTGLLVGLPSILALLAPTVNSYKRFVSKYWAPVYVNWGFESRTASVRVIGPEIPADAPKSTGADRERLITAGKAMRLEMRVGGADINSHLAIAACLACGLWGIRHRLHRLPLPDLQAMNPKEGQIPTVLRVEGLDEGTPRVIADTDANHPHGLRLSRNLREAVEVMRAPDSIARQVLGDDFVNHYARTREHEWQLWENAVTDWERKRYMEII
ncbi:hypothetical protein IWQ60_010533 [Tieghemiomyces parasiticus]|uniref:Glutamine synthetase n=1 Tax=Tieghemiomyces parasiticus TaxID=78921 RepID=A0A9W8DMT9_9FUNG|nr:hypothetical protein IWQ60_010533 [Tieghemiomyces parasiticus]